MMTKPIRITPNLIFTLILLLLAAKSQCGVGGVEPFLNGVPVMSSNPGPAVAAGGSGGSGIRRGQMRRGGGNRR